LIVIVTFVGGFVPFLDSECLQNAARPYTLYIWRAAIDVNEYADELIPPRLQAQMYLVPGTGGAIDPVRREGYDMKPHTRQHPVTTDKDISSLAFWTLPFDEREQTFGWLRQHAPVSWHLPMEVPGWPPELHGESGFWAVVRAADVAYVSQNQELFSSDLEKHGAAVVQPIPGDFTRKPSFLGMDPPRHTKYRRVISKHFTPKGVARLQDKLNERAAQIVDRVIGAGDIDFVKEVSAKLPMLTIADLVGVPDDMVDAFTQAGDNYVGFSDPEVVGDANPIEFVLKQIDVLREIGVELVAERRKHPADDLATALAEVDVDGLPLDDEDIEAMMVLLSVAGNDTTKQTTSHVVVQLWRHPEQKKWLQDDYDGRIATATEEFLRFATPVLNFARTATEDVELGGQQIEVGDKVGLFYCSANRDESVYPEPHRFDITRPLSAHQAFGGGGVHYCLGNVLAKAQLRTLFKEFLTKLPDMEVGEPEMLESSFLNGVRRLPVRIS
jgi:cytochrome P450